MVKFTIVEYLMYTIDEIEKISEKIKSITMISIVLNAIRIQIN